MEKKRAIFILLIALNLIGPILIMKLDLVSAGTMDGAKGRKGLDRIARLANEIETESSKLVGQITRPQRRRGPLVQATRGYRRWPANGQAGQGRKMRTTQSRAYNIPNNTNNFVLNLLPQKHRRVEQKRSKQD